jgi:hypothetical protein
MRDAPLQDLDGFAACRGIPGQSECEGSERLELQRKTAERTAHRGDGERAEPSERPGGLVAGIRNLAIGLFRLKAVTNIKEATELVHLDLTRAITLMAT